MGCVRHHGDSELLKPSHSHIKNGHALNSQFEILQTTSPKPYVLLGKNLMVGISQISQMLKSLHSDTNDGHALNSQLEILQTTPSRPYFLLSKNLMVGISQISRMLKSLHSDTNDGHALNSLLGILQTTSSKLYALLRFRIAKILPFRYQRWPWTEQPSWNSTNNIFPPIFLLEQKIDASLQGKMETQNRLGHSIQISKMAIHIIAILKFFKQHLPPNHMSS